MRALKAAVIVMGVLIVVGTATLAVLIVQKLNSAAGTVAARAPTVLDEPAGTRIAGLAASGDRLAVQLQGGGADRVVVIDLRSLSVAGRIALAR